MRDTVDFITACITMNPKKPFVFSSKISILMIIGLFLSVGVPLSMAFTASPNFQERYDEYFPQNSQSAEGGYRKWFDRTIFNSHARSSLSKNDKLLYDAIRGGDPEVHKFLHSNYRTMDGEFGETWNCECLLILIYLDDEQFAELLVNEDRKTKVLVRNAINYQVSTRKNMFPQTNRILTLATP